MKIPDAFLKKMKRLLKEDEFNELVNALQGQRQYGLRVNTIKADIDEFKEVSPFHLEPVPWTNEGFYTDGEKSPGRHPYYYAGLYYIQEPSAMLPGQILGAQPGEKVLDLCAAPGGKTVQIAAAMKGRGLLFSNDINSERIKALNKNIELCGIRNAIVLNESPKNLLRNFEGYFDRIIVDAPCSGEGMFRKDEAAARSWESFKCERCTKLQEPILESADRLLKSGGTLVYSTCTFSPEEDEQMISQFINRHNGYELVDIPKIAGIEGGRPEWAGGCKALERTARLWPHKVRGEGHFVAKLIKNDMCNLPVNASSCDNFTSSSNDSESNNIDSASRCDDSINKTNKAYETERGSGNRKMKTEDSVYKNRPINTEKFLFYENLPDSFHEFVNNNLNHFPEGVYLQNGRNLYHLPETPAGMDGLKVAKFGWFLGIFENNKFEPSHSMAAALKMQYFKRTVNLNSNDPDVAKYIKGETLLHEGEKGYTAVCVNGWTLGWAKQTGDMLKNLYPKGWRKLN